MRTNHGRLAIFPIIVSFTTSIMAEVHVSIYDENYDNNNVVVSTDRQGNTDYIYVDKDSQIINSTIGTNIYINQSTPRTKEESIIYYNERIDYYNSKINDYNDKINHYKEKIVNKPKYKERYNNKITKYVEKINSYKNKINSTELKLAELKK